MSIIGVILEQGSGVPDAGLGFAEVWTKVQVRWTTRGPPVRGGEPLIVKALHGWHTSEAGVPASAGFG